MNVVLYARVSSDRQADKGASIPSQLEELHRWCDREGHTVLREFTDEGISGTTDKRPGFQSMIAFCKLRRDEVDAVVVWKFNRFSRDRVDSAVYKRHLRTHGVNVISVTEPIAESIDAGLLEAVVEATDSRFSKSLAQDVIRGTRDAARRGFYPLSQAPLGCRRREVKDGKAKRFTLVPDSSTAPLVRRIFDLYVGEGLGAKNVAQRLNAEGLTTRTGRRWSTKGVLRVLRNPIYVGTLHIEFTTENARFVAEEDRSVTVEGAFPPLVSREVFHAAKAQLEKRSRSSPRGLASDYLLSGLLRCGKCGAKMYGVSAKSGRHHYYACNRFYQEGKATCDYAPVNQERLDGAVVGIVRDRLLQEECLVEVAREANAELGEREALIDEERSLVERQLKEKQTQIDRLLDAVEANTAPRAAVGPRLTARHEEVQRLEDRLSALEMSRESVELTAIDIERIRPYIETLRETLDHATVRAQRSILGSFIEKIDVSDSELEVEFRIPRPETPGRDDGGVLGTVTSGTPERIRTSDLRIRSATL